MFSTFFKKLYRQTIDIVFGVILALIIIGIAIGAGQLVFSVWDLLKLEGVTGQYINIITDVLTLYVFCLLYTYYSVDEEDCVNLGCRCVIKEQINYILYLYTDNFTKI